METDLPSAEVSKPWNVSIPDETSDDYYNKVCAYVRQQDIETSRLMLSLKMYPSPHVGIISTPEQAADHIRICREKGMPIGGFEYKESPKAKKSTLQNFVDERGKEKAEELRLHKLQIEQMFHKEWKEAVRKRAEALAQWDEFVKSKHSNLKTLKEMSIEEFESWVKSSK